MFATYLYSGQDRKRNRPPPIKIVNYEKTTIDNGYTPRYEDDRPMVMGPLESIKSAGLSTSRPSSPMRHHSRVGSSRGKIKRDDWTTNIRREKLRGGRNFQHLHQAEQGSSKWEKPHTHPADCIMSMRSGVHGGVVMMFQTLVMEHLTHMDIWEVWMGTVMPSYVSIEESGTNVRDFLDLLLPHISF